MNNTPAGAATLIWEALHSGGALEALPEGCRPRTRAEGYAIQAFVPGLAGQALVGWKLAATSVAGQHHIGVSGPLAGRILAGAAHRTGATVSLRGNHMLVVEAEFGFVMARDLAPRAAAYSGADVLTAVGAVVPVIEVPNSRFPDFVQAGEAQLLADLACAGQFAVGDGTGAPWQDIPFAEHLVHGQVLRDGSSVLERTGTGAAVLGDPRTALAWLVNELSALGITLEAGQLVSTGTCIEHLPIQAGDRIQADFGILGQVTVCLS